MLRMVSPARLVSSLDTSNFLRADWPSQFISRIVASASTGETGEFIDRIIELLLLSHRIGIIGSFVFGALIRLECRPKILNLMKQNIQLGNVWFDGTRRGVRRRVRDNRVRFGVGTSSRLACFQRHRDASTILSRCATVLFKRKFFVRGKKVGTFKSRFPRRGVLLAEGNALHGAFFF